MTLDTWTNTNTLYRARGDEVSRHRPIFTGDVLEPIAVAGVQTEGAAIIIAHPCSMRGPNAQLVDDILMARVAPHDPVPARKWAGGYYDRMPLPELRGPGQPFEVAQLGRMGPARRADIEFASRIACLDEVGLNILQQRLTCYLTRAEIPTPLLWDAFAHTYEEAELLEEWNEDLTGTTVSADLAAEFELWLRAEQRQDRLRDPQQRASIRSQLRAEIGRRRAS